MVLVTFVYGDISENCWYMTIILGLPHDIFGGVTFFNQKRMEYCGNWDSLRTQGFQRESKRLLSLDKGLAYTATYWVISELCHS